MAGCESRLDAPIDAAVTPTDVPTSGPAPKKPIVHATDVPQAVRLDGFNHWPVPIPNSRYSQRCKFSGCKGKTYTRCDKCKVYLCMQVKELSYFAKFHGK